MKNKKYLALVMAVLIVGLATACSSEPKRVTAENVSDSGKNAIPGCEKRVPITVILDPGYPDKGRVDVLEKYEVPKRIEYAIACEMDRQGYVPTSEFDIKVSITSFRLRSGGSTVMFGFFAGSDNLRIGVRVEAADQTTPWRFVAHSHTARDLTAPTPSQRLNAMVQDLARYVVTKIKKRGLLKDANSA